MGSTGCATGAPEHGTSHPARWSSVLASPIERALTTNATLDPCLCSVIQAETICRCPSPDQDLAPGHIVIHELLYPGAALAAGAWHGQPSEHQDEISCSAAARTDCGGFQGVFVFQGLVRWIHTRGGQREQEQQQQRKQRHLVRLDSSSTSFSRLCVPTPLPKTGTSLIPVLRRNRNRCVSCHLYINSP